VCGRFALFTVDAALAEYWGLDDIPADARALLTPRYNVAPGQAIVAARIARDGRRSLAALHWGLVPFWAKDRAVGYRLINARADGLTSKPAFREAAARRHCLIPANGFYEWAQVGGPKKRPFFVTLQDRQLMAFAGLWERWRSGDSILESCTIVTTEANSALAPIHDRMPVVLAREDQARWLDPATAIETCLTLARDSAAFTSWPVGWGVNDPRRDDQELIEPHRATS
jgi:putative SOS response-associated peptidase YedK